MIILLLIESLKTMNRLDPKVTVFEDLFLEKYKGLGREIFTQSSFKSSICATQIRDQYL